MGGGFSGKFAERGAPALTSESRSGVLHSPTFLVALVVLVVNDRWLKGAGVLPGWLTGKLSDFAGLVVAPLLLVVLLRARRRTTRLACFATVALGFAALELWPRLALLVEQLTRAVGLDWRLWPDPTDLLALCMLPLTWRALHSSARPVALPLDKLIGALAAVACLATSSEVVRVKTAVALLNTTHDDIELQVFRATPIDCEAVAEDPEALLEPRDFQLEACVNLEMFEPLPLDVDSSLPLVDGEFPPALERACDAVLLRAKGLPDTVIFWNDVTKKEVYIDDAGGSPGGTARLAFIENLGAELVLTPPEVVRSFVATKAPPTVECPAEAP